MARNPAQSADARNSNPNFILSKVDTAKFSDPTRPTLPQTRSACEREDFIEQALAHMGAHAVFSVLAIEIDPKENADEWKSATGSMSRWLEQSSRREGGIWGLLNEGCWALFMPGKNAVQSETTAREIRACATQDNHTLTIGIAAFPTLDYSRRDILVNACKALEHARFFGPDSQAAFDAVSLNISGDQHYDAGDLNGAIAEFERALRLSPKDANLHNSMGVCHADRGDWDQALACFETALRLKKKDPLAAYNIAMVHRLSGDAAKALDFFELAAAGREALFEAKLQIGRILLERRQPEPARQHLEEAAELRPGIGQVLSLLGDCHSALGREEAARTAYKKALRANANDAVALSGLGWIYHNRGENSDIATLFCRQSVEIAPDNGLYRYRLARRHLAENRLKEAQHQFEKAARLGFDTGNYLEIIRNRRMEKAS